MAYLVAAALQVQLRAWAQGADLAHVRPGFPSGEYCVLCHLISFNTSNVIQYHAVLVYVMQSLTLRRDQDLGGLDYPAKDLSSYHVGQHALCVPRMREQHSSMFGVCKVSRDLLVSFQRKCTGRSPAVWTPLFHNH